MANTFRNLQECVVLPIGTEVSAKFKGAFCEAVIESVNKNIEIKVLEHGTQKLFALSDLDVEGNVEVGCKVKFTLGEQKFEGIVKKITDKSVYRVVFNDGDESFLKRNSLCLKGERNFSVPKTSSSTSYEPSMNKDRTRSKSSDTACSKETVQPYKVGSVVIVEMDNQCFPALVLTRISGDTLCVRNFIDGEDFHVNIKNVTEEFDLSKSDLVGKKIPCEALCNAENYIKKNEIPETWPPLHEVFVSESSSDDENFESKDSFIADVLHYFEDRGTPLNQEFNVNGYDLDVYKLYNLVKKLGGFVKVTNKCLWKSIYIRMGHPLEGDVGELMKNAYKTYLYDFAELKKKLGCSLVPSITADTKRSRKFPKDRFIAEVQPKKKGKRAIGDRRNGNSNSSNAFSSLNCSNPDRSTDQSESCFRVSMNAGSASYDHLSDVWLPDVAHTCNDLAILSSSLGEVTPDAAVDSIANINEHVSGCCLEKTKESENIFGRASKNDEVMAAIPRRTKISNQELQNKPKRKRKSTDLTRKLGQHKLAKKPVRKSDLKHVSVRHTSDNWFSSRIKKFAFNEIPLKSIVKVLWCGSGNGKHIYKAKVIMKNPSANAVLVHYVGWNSRYDQWISPEAILEIDSSPCNRYNSSSSDSLVHSKRSALSISFPPRSLSVIEPSRISSSDSFVAESNISPVADTPQQNQKPREGSESFVCKEILEDCVSVLSEITTSFPKIQVPADKTVKTACKINEDSINVGRPVNPSLLNNLKNLFASISRSSNKITDDFSLEDAVFSSSSDAGAFEQNSFSSEESRQTSVYLKDDSDLPTEKSIQPSVDPIIPNSHTSDFSCDTDSSLFFEMTSNESMGKESNEIMVSNQNHSEGNVSVTNLVSIIKEQPHLNETDDKKCSFQRKMLTEIENCQTCANISLLPESEVLLRLDKLLPKENRLSLEDLDSLGLIQEIPGCTPGEAALVRAQYFHKKLTELLAETENTMLMELRMKAHQNKHHGNT